MSTDAPTPGPVVAVDGLSGSIADGKANDGAEALSGEPGRSESWAQVEALAALLEPEAFDPNQPADETWREVTQQRALGHAARIITSSDWVRVVEDDDTIERAAKALAAFDGYVWSEDDGAADNVANPDYYLRRARAVVRALREET